jgi:maleylacetoacetate isomerase/maleylpyruvate isomerase
MADAAGLHLYGFWRSMAAYRVRVALNLKGLHAQETALNLDAGDQFAPEYLAVNPEGAVPALVEPGQSPITQSMAILEYLEEVYPRVPLLPADPHGRARVRSLCGLIVSDTHPLLTPRVGKYLRETAGLDEAAMRAWRLHWITRCVTALETRLARDAATGAVCHGDSVTLADICLASLLAVAKTMGFQPTDAPTVTRIVEACEALEAFQKANPLRQAGAPQSARS